MGRISRRRALATAVATSALIATVTATVGGAPPAAADVGGLPVEEASVASIRAAIEDGSATCRDVVEESLARIEAYDDQGPQLNAVLEVSDDALSTAEALDEQYADEGFTGPLHCVPVLLKDNYDTADLPTTAASATLEGAQPPDDA